MTKDEKKKFFDMDLAERMIRVEQHISSTFNKPVTYEQTEYFKSLSAEQKTEFKNYLKNKKRKTLVFLFLLFIFPLTALSLLNISFTGNVVSENAGQAGVLIGWLAIGVIFVAAVIYVINIIYKRRSNKRFKKHLRILEEIYVRKRYSKNKKHF